MHALPTAFASAGVKIVVEMTGGRNGAKLNPVPKYTPTN